MTRLKLRKSLISKGAGRRIRTDDLLITTQLLRSGRSYYAENAERFLGDEPIPMEGAKSYMRLHCDKRTIFLSLPS